MFAYVLLGFIFGIVAGSAVCFWIVNGSTQFWR